MPSPARRTAIFCRPERFPHPVMSVLAFWRLMTTAVRTMPTAQA